MRMLVAGCGSIGRRHAANARELGEAAVMDPNDAVRGVVAGELGIPGFGSMDEALAWAPDCVVVATPTHLHLPVAEQAVRAGAHVLVEKPLSHDLEGTEEFLALARKRGVMVRVVCNMRFHPAIRALRDGVKAIGRPLFARAQYGNYLPDMRPCADYRELYCANRSMGGGVILDAIHEIDYLAWLFGPVESVRCEAATVSDLDIDVEDYAGMIMRHAGGVRSEVHLDYLQRYKRRGCEVAGTEGTVVWLSEGKAPETCIVRLYRAGTGAWETLLDAPALNAGHMYFDMLESFAAAVKGEGDGLLDGPGARGVLGAVLAAKQSVEHGGVVEL